MVQPLRAKTMGISELQLATLDLIRKVRFQLARQAHEDGMSDSEFLSEIVAPLEQQIYADRSVIRDARRARVRRKISGSVDSQERPAHGTVAEW